MSVVLIKGTERTVVSTGLSLSEARVIKRNLIDELETFYIVRICTK